MTNEKFRELVNIVGWREDKDEAAAAILTAWTELRKINIQLRKKLNLAAKAIEGMGEAIDSMPCSAQDFMGEEAWTSLRQYRKS